MSNRIKVWDPLVRIFHWSLVIAFTVAYLSGEEESDLHIYSGYIVAGLISFRLLWGLVGTRYARFASFVYAPGTVIHYIRGMAAGKPEHFTGHNPAGGWMVIAMLVTLTVVSVSGLKVYALEEGLGPLAGNAPAINVIDTAYADSDEEEYEDHDKSVMQSEGDENAEEFWEEIHEASSNLMLFLIFLHVAGVFVSSRLHGENLVKAMITGKKVSRSDH